MVSRRLSTVVGYGARTRALLGASSTPRRPCMDSEDDDLIRKISGIGIQDREFAFEKAGPYQNAQPFKKVEEDFGDVQEENEKPGRSLNGPARSAWQSSPLSIPPQQPINKKRKAEGDDVRKSLEDLSKTNGNVNVNSKPKRRRRRMLLET